MASSRSTFVNRLMAAEEWDPDLRRYATSYLVSNTSRPLLLGLLIAAGHRNHPSWFIKADGAETLVSSTAPHELAELWQRRRPNWF